MNPTKEKKQRSTPNLMAVPKLGGGKNLPRCPWAALILSSQVTSLNAMWMKSPWERCPVVCH